MPNAERSKKRKADLLSESAVKCRKLSDLFQSQRQLDADSGTNPKVLELLTMIQEASLDYYSKKHAQINLQNSRIFASSKCGRIV